MTQTDETPTRELTYAEMDEIFRKLRAMKVECTGKMNKHDRAIVLITMCITEGLYRGQQIARTLGAIGLNRQHVGKLLKDETGNFWERLESGRYVLLDSA
jgi:hypothetical protein